MTSGDPNQEDGKSERGDGTADENSRQAGPQMAQARAESDSPPSPDKSRESCHEKRDWLDYVKFGGEMVGLLFLIGYTTFAGLQWYEMHRALLTDQRAWISVDIPSSTFPLDGNYIPVVLKIENSGKTAAKQMEGDVIATVLDKGEGPALDLLTDVPHNKIYAGAIFPNAPFDMAVTVARYGQRSPETIVLDDTLRQGIANGSLYIIVYGRITYYDVFGVQHWTQFCMGTGSAIRLPAVEKCIAYNDVDNN